MSKVGDRVVKKDDKLGKVYYIVGYGRMGDDTMLSLAENKDEPNSRKTITVGDWEVKDAPPASSGGRRRRGSRRRNTRRRKTSKNRRN